MIGHRPGTDLAGSGTPVTPPILAVVPMRLASVRLPRKPLHPILGRPLLEWVWRRISPMGLFTRIVFAVDSEELREACVRVGAPVVLTDPLHPSGTDRVAEVVERSEFREFPVIVNVQGDEPLVQERDLLRAVELVRAGPWEVGTCATPVRDAAAFRDPSVVKVARGEGGRALYFSRAPIPFARDGAPGPEALAAPPFLRHLGIYAYRRDALLRWVGLPPSPLEELERLEQLRALEAGIQIGVAVVDRASPGVDTAEDVARMEALLRAQGAAAEDIDRVEPGDPETQT
jgi:3-deoxy-manno-octulosonate cytidylyltransferase (CMP-KDO synthetase)